MSYEFDADFRPLGCKDCLDRNPLDFEITMAFHPIVDLRRQRVFAYEALVRGKDGAGAGEILSRVEGDNRYTFDQTCRVRAIELATHLGLDCILSINFLPNAVYRPETCIRATIEASDMFGFSPEKIMFEVTESEPIENPAHLQGIFREYQKRGFITAIDDFGAGYAGLNLLTKFEPEVLKLDMELCQGIAESRTKRVVTEGIVNTTKGLGISIIAEGIEKEDDLSVLIEMGVDYFQGFYFCEPKIEALPKIDFPTL